MQNLQTFEEFLNESLNSETINNFTNKFEREGYNENSKEFKKGLQVIEKLISYVDKLNKSKIVSNLGFKYSYRIDGSTVIGMITLDMNKVQLHFRKEMIDAKFAESDNFNIRNWTVNKIANIFNDIIGTKYSSVSYIHNHGNIGFEI